MATAQDIRARVTAEIVAALENDNLPPWKCPWSTSGPPANAATGRRYTGINVLLLQLHRQRLGLTSSRYATFNQWHEIGCRVKARPLHIPSGRWGCNVVFCKQVTKKPKDAEDGHKRDDKYLALRNFSVFSADQVDGEAADRLWAEARNRVDFIDYIPAERAIAATGADIRHGGDRAYYRRPVAGADGDYVQMPDKLRFAEEKDYYQTVLHELAGHWTEHRLGWTGSYAEGELRAELTASFAATDLGLPHGDRANSTSYLAYWLGAMKADPRYIFRVTADASRAANYFLGFSCQQQDQPEEVAVV